MSPFRFFGGSHDTITFVFDAGMALISCGADGTLNGKIFRLMSSTGLHVQPCLTIFMCATKERFCLHSITDFCKS